MKFIPPYIVALAACALLCGCGAPSDAMPAATAPDIFPDYAGITVPANIAPPNFRIEGDVRQSEARFEACGRSFTVRGRDGGFVIPRRKWRRMAAAARDAAVPITVTLYARGGDGWRVYDPFTIEVAAEPIDPYVVYRLIEPGYETWGEMGIYQRCLETYREEPVIENSAADYGCMNCHSFCMNNPERMLFHMRQEHAGTVIVDGDRIERVDTSSPETLSPLVYPSWHPSGRFVAFSVNTTKLITLPSDRNRVEVFDSASDVVVYDTERHEILASPLTADSARYETFPAFSPDGRTLYFCSADSVRMPDEYRQARYSLCSIAFDPDTRRFGDTVDTLYNARTHRRSVSFPRVSPDGRFLLYALADYGNFSIWHRDADLRMIDLAAREEIPVDALNSDEAESYHSWSGNGRWVAFNSRRIDGLYTHVYIARVDERGGVSKPFVLPQRNPDFYRTFMKSFNIPELVGGRIGLSSHDFVSHAENAEVRRATFSMQGE